MPEAGSRDRVRNSRGGGPITGGRGRIESPKELSASSVGRDLEWLSTMYRDNKEYARFHEDQRQKTAQLIIVTCLGIVSIITAFDADFRTAPLAIILIYLTYFGRTMALKQYERVGRNTAIAHGIRKQIKEILPLGGAAVERAYDEAEHSHREKIAPLSAKFRTDLVSLSLEEHWLGLYRFIFIIGVIALIFAVSSGVYELCVNFGCDIGAVFGWRPSR